MKNKVNKGLLITVIALVLVIGLLIFKLSKDTTSTSKNSNTTSDNNTQVVEGAKDFDLNEAKQILDKFGFNYSIGCGNTIYGSFYSESFKQSIVLKQVSDSVKTKKKCSEIYTETTNSYKGDNSAYKGQYGVCFEDKGTNLIPYDEANKIYKEMYGNDMPKKGFNTSDVGGMYYNFYDYNESLNSFVQLECGGCGGACGPTGIVINKIKSAYTIGDSLVIDVYYFYANELRTGVSSGEEYKILSTTKNDIRLESKDMNAAEKEIEEKYLDKLDTYEVVFTKKDGNYIFKSLTKKLS